MAQLNTYGFLYFKRPGDKDRYCTFRGNDLADAARKMATLLNRLRRTYESWSNPQVDYEVDVNCTRLVERSIQPPAAQLDLYSLGESHPIREFLP